MSFEVMLSVSAIVISSIALGFSIRGMFTVKQRVEVIHKNEEKEKSRAKIS